MPSFIRLVHKVYPYYSAITNSIRILPLKARSLLIKQCQAQYDIQEPFPTPLPTIIRLLQSHPDVPYITDQLVSHLPLTRFFSTHGISVQDPLQSAIVLDLLRGLPVQQNDIDEFRFSGWVKEIRLGWESRSGSVNFTPFFHHTGEVPHPDLPDNPLALTRIRMKFRAFRQRLVDHTPTYYPRSTHKNMSRSTRRCFEEVYGEDSLGGIPIFGQDDWMRVYNRDGIKLGGDVELRQKWYPSGAKPRTYAAMGGLAYEKCRHLQEFFTDLCTIFPATHHKTRLRPGRLYVPPPSEHASYRVYDLTSFTSNMAEQRNFCDALAEYFNGVPVILVDEVDGQVERDLGEMLREYNSVCVNGPQVSVERAPGQLHPPEVSFKHGTASLLGIFGNLMTCTVAHYLILAPCTDADDEDNTAGDDGLIMERDYTTHSIDNAISLVGDWEPTKNFQTTEEGAVCLKRPIVQTFDSLILGDVVTPPTLVTCATYLLGVEVDSRYAFPGLNDMSLDRRVDIVGVDLMRFLRSAWRLEYQDVELLANIYEGFCRMASHIIGSSVEIFRSKHPMILWPLNPRDYDFLALDPLMVWSRLFCGTREFPVYEYEDCPVWQLREVGDSVKCNGSPRLQLLEKLEYVEKEMVRVTLPPERAVNLLYLLFSNVRLPPRLYTYRCIRDIPEQFLYEG